MGIGHGDWTEPPAACLYCPRRSWGRIRRRPHAHWSVYCSSSGSHVGRGGGDFGLGRDVQHGGGRTLGDRPLAHIIVLVRATSGGRGGEGGRESMSVAHWCKKSIIRLSRGKIPPVALEGPPALSSRQNGGCTQALASPPHKTETHSKQPRSRRGLTPASASKKNKNHCPCENPAPSATWVLGPPGPALAGPLTPRIGPPRPTGTPVGVPLTPPTPHPPAPLRGGAVPSVSGARPARDTHHPRRGAAGGR